MRTKQDSDWAHQVSVQFATPDKLTPKPPQVCVMEEDLVELTKRFFPWRAPKYVGMLIAEHFGQAPCSFCYSVLQPRHTPCPYCSHGV